MPRTGSVDVDGPGVFLEHTEKLEPDKPAEQIASHRRRKQSVNNLRGCHGGRYLIDRLADRPNPLPREAHHDPGHDNSSQRGTVGGNCGRQGGGEVALRGGRRGADGHGTNREELDLGEEGRFLFHLFCFCFW